MGIFITLEGIEGAGKSTALKFISEFLTRYKVNHVTTREFGGTEIAEKIRDILLNSHDETMCANTELLLAFAARAQHISKFILPALNTGLWVICDRFTDSSYAYQHGGRGIPISQLLTLENMVQYDFRPTCTILFDVSPEIGLKRVQESKGGYDRIEKEHINFFHKVRQCYLKRARNNPRFSIVHADKSILDVEKQLNQICLDWVQRFSL